MMDASNVIERLKQSRKHYAKKKGNAIKDSLNYFNLF